MFLVYINTCLDLKRISFYNSNSRIDKRRKCIEVFVFYPFFCVQMLEFERSFMFRLCLDLHIWCLYFLYLTVCFSENM
jgi:hypothetical protein